MNKFERLSLFSGLLLGFISILVSCNSNKIAREANDLAKQQQSARLLLLEFSPIRSQIAPQDQTQIIQAHASCLYRIRLINIGGQTDIVGALDTKISFFSDGKELEFSNSGTPLSVSNQDYNYKDKFEEDITSISMNIVNRKIENLDTYDWDLNPDGVNFPLAVAPNEAKELFLLYTITYSTKQTAFSSEDAFLLEEGVFDIGIELSMKPEFSSETNLSGSPCLSFWLS